MSNTPPGDAHAPYLDNFTMDEDYDGKPTEEELKSLRRVPGSIPIIAYLICIVEFCERGSYYGVQPLIGNYVNRPLPEGGNGWGAPPPGQGTGGALGMGTKVANAVAQSFSMLVYALPLLFGWMADAKTGRFKLICWGVGVFGVAHVLLIGSGAKELLANGTAKAPFFISVYILAVGAGELSKPRGYSLGEILTLSSHVQTQRLSTAAGSSDDHSAKGDHNIERRKGNPGPRIDD